MKFKDIIRESINCQSTKEHDCELELNVNGETWDAYSVSISHKDLLFYCEQGIATYVVDSYGDKHIAELYSWDKSE